MQSFCFNSLPTPIFWNRNYSLTCSINTKDRVQGTLLGESRQWQQGHACLLLRVLSKESFWLVCWDPAHTLIYVPIYKFTTASMAPPHSHRDVSIMMPHSKVLISKTDFFFLIHHPPPPLSGQGWCHQSSSVYFIFALLVINGCFFTVTSQQLFFWDRVSLRSPGWPEIQRPTCLWPLKLFRLHLQLRWSCLWGRNCGLLRAFRGTFSCFLKLGHNSSFPNFKP